MSDAYKLQRFLDVQERVYDTVLAELRTGRKSSHWIWFIFPQIAGLGHSAVAQQFAIGSLDEAKAYIQHSVLGQRLRECTQLVLDVNGRSAEEILGYPNNLKFRSCMTLFVAATTDNTLFKNALLTYFDGKPDQSTLDILTQAAGAIPARCAVTLSVRIERLHFYRERSAAKNGPWPPFPLSDSYLIFRLVGLSLALAERLTGCLWRRLPNSKSS